ncbi:MAG: hypothetical protein AB1742_04670 [bacterium]
MTTPLEERFWSSVGELENLAGELLDVLETLNFHSAREAAEDLHSDALPIVSKMLPRLRSVYLAASSHPETFSRHLSPAKMNELTDMNELLDSIRHCSAEHKSFQNFLSNLVPLLDLLKKWAYQGLAAAPPGESPPTTPAG